jgi:hypothetical protein
MRRDIARIHENLIQQKRILMLGDDSNETALSMGDDDLKNTVRRVRGLFCETELTIAINPGML